MWSPESWSHPPGRLLFAVHSRDQTWLAWLGSLLDRTRAGLSRPVVESVARMDGSEGKSAGWRRRLAHRRCTFLTRQSHPNRDFLFVARVSGCWGVAEGLLVAAAAVACLLDFVNIFKLRNSLFRKSIIQINFWLHHSDPCIEIFKTRSHLTTFKNIF